MIESYQLLFLIQDQNVIGLKSNLIRTSLNKTQILTDINKIDVLDVISDDDEPAISMYQIDAMQRSLKKSRKVCFYSTSFTSEIFIHLMTILKNCNSTFWALTNFEGDIESYIPNPGDEFKMAKVCFWMKLHGVKCFEHFAKKTNLTHKLKHVEIIRDPEMEIDGFEPDQLFQDFERIGNVILDDAEKYDI